MAQIYRRRFASAVLLIKAEAVAFDVDIGPIRAVRNWMAEHKCRGYVGTVYGSHDIVAWLLDGEGESGNQEFQAIHLANELNLMYGQVRHTETLFERTDFKDSGPSHLPLERDERGRPHGDVTSGYHLILASGTSAFPRTDIVTRARKFFQDNQTTRLLAAAELIGRYDAALLVQRRVRAGADTSWNDDEILT